MRMISRLSLTSERFAGTEEFSSAGFEPNVIEVDPGLHRRANLQIQMLIALAMKHPFINNQVDGRHRSAGSSLTSFPSSGGSEFTSAF